MTLRHPPGRSGRLWLLERHAVAERAANILQRKQEALAHEQVRLATRRERTEQAWFAAVTHAEAAQRRALMLGARSTLVAAAAASETAAIELRWENEMGVRFPTTARCRLPPPVAMPGPPALGAAVAAYREALEAAIEHAEADDAARRISDELRRTSQRLRAVHDRRIPALNAALRDLELRLDEQEREELVRTTSRRSQTEPRP